MEGVGYEKWWGGLPSPPAECDHWRTWKSALQTQSVMFRIKICGITKPDDACLVAEAGADAIGLNFYAKSKRYVAREIAKEIAAELPASVAKVGVFVNASAGEIRELASEVPLDYVQLHGDEPTEMIAELAPLQVIRALRIRDSSLEPVQSFLDASGLTPNLKAILLDAYSSSEYGGTGQSLDWEALADSRELFRDLAIVLAGGLTPDNVAQAIRLAQPFAVDTASGVESSPGVKDAQKVKAFVQNAKKVFNG